VISQSFSVSVIAGVFVLLCNFHPSCVVNFSASFRATSAQPSDTTAILLKSPKNSSSNAKTKSNEPNQEPIATESCRTQFFVMAIWSPFHIWC
jgi:hypothetical protein